MNQQGTITNTCENDNKQSFVILLFSNYLLKDIWFPAHWRRYDVFWIVHVGYWQSVTIYLMFINEHMIGRHSLLQNMSKAIHNLTLTRDIRRRLMLSYMNQYATCNIKGGKVKIPFSDMHLLCTNIVIEIKVSFSSAHLTAGQKHFPRLTLWSPSNLVHVYRKTSWTKALRTSLLHHMSR